MIRWQMIEVFAMNINSNFKVVAGRGNNLHEVKTQTGETFLVSMPTKFRLSMYFCDVVTCMT